MTEEQKPEDRSFILFEFAAIGSVMCRTMFNNVTPLQMLAVAGMLESHAKRMLMEEEIQREAQRGIATPPPPKIIIPGS